MGENATERRLFLMGNVIAFPSPQDDPTLEQRLAARKVCRAALRMFASAAVARDFSQAGKLPGARELGVDDVLPMFVAAMRRELKKSGLF